MAWVAIAGAVVSLGVKYVVPLFRKKKYTPGGYELGAMYRRNVLGENFPNTDDDRKIGDEAAFMARHIFTAGFGIVVPNRAWYNQYIFTGDIEGYRKKCKADYGIEVNAQAFARAHQLAKTYFPDQAAPPKFLWDLRNFDTMPYVAKIPDPDNPKKNMTISIDGVLYVNDGVIVNPNSGQVAVIQHKEAVEAVSAAQQKDGNKNLLILGGLAAAGVGALLYFNTKKKRK